jgi:hypothetical protein
MKGAVRTNTTWSVVLALTWMDSSPHDSATETSRYGVSIFQAGKVASRRFAFNHGAHVIIRGKY